VSKVEHAEESWKVKEDRCLATLALVISTWLLGSWAAQSQPDLEGHQSERLRTTDQKWLIDAQFQLNINRASPREWSVLPGIGPVLSQRIVDHRTTHGPFRRIEDLEQVHGIGPKTVTRVGHWLTRGETSEGCVNPASQRPTE